VVAEVQGASWELELVPVGMFVRRVVTLGDPAATRVILDIEPKSGKVAFKISGSGPSMAKPQDMLLLLEQVLSEASAVYDGTEEPIERGENDGE